MTGNCLFANRGVLGIHKKSREINIKFDTQKKTEQSQDIRQGIHEMPSKQAPASVRAEILKQKLIYELSRKT